MHKLVVLPAFKTAHRSTRYGSSSPRRLLDCLTHTNGTERLCRNVGDQLPASPHNIPEHRKSHLHYPVLLCLEKLCGSCWSTQKVVNGHVQPVRTNTCVKVISVDHRHKVSVIFEAKQVDGKTSFE